MASWALSDQTLALREQIGADPRIADAHDQWTACMTGKGHGFVSQDDILAHLDAIRQRLNRRVQASGGPDHISPDLQADIYAFGDTEIELAAADRACSKARDRVIHEVTVEHEQQFLADNQNRLRRQLPTATLPPGLAVFRDFSTGAGTTARFLR